MNVAIIPARGGSKRIPNKNIKLFAGKPIIAYSIEAAKATGVFEHIIVTTDSDEIAEVSRAYGAEVPFMRPPELADDLTPTAPVLVHALEWLAENGKSAQYTCAIYPTAPVIQPVHIREGLSIVSSKRGSSAFSVTTFPFSVHRALRINEEGSLEMLWPAYEMTRSNDLPVTYHDAGQFYWFDCKVFLREPRMYGQNSWPVVLPRYLVQDIDTPEDWETAEQMFRALNSRTSLGRGGG